jgi:hypothetical protein
LEPDFLLMHQCLPANELIDITEFFEFGRSSMRSYSGRWFQREDLIPVAVLLIPVAMWVSRLLRIHSILGGGDNRLYFYPMTAAGMEQWRAGIVPLWTTKIQSGFPLLADGQGALLYPLNLLAYFTLPAPLAYNLGIAVHAMLAAVFMYALVRVLGAGRWPAVLAGWLYVFAGPIAPNLGSPALHGLALWPLLFLLAERLSRRASRRLIAATGAVMGLGWLGGFPQTTLYGIAGASAYILFRSITKDGHELRSTLISAGAWIAAACIGIGIGAIQLLPTLEMSSHSVRAGGVEFSLASQGSMFPTGFLGFLLPTWGSLGTYGLAGTNQYITLIGLAGALLTLRRSSEKRILFFWALAILGCFLSLGKFNPVYQWIYHLPGLHFLRIPARFLYWTTFSLAILSAFGIERAFSDSRRTHEIRRLLACLSVLVGITVGGTIVGSYILHSKGDSLVRLAQEHANSSLLGHAYRLQNKAYYEDRITRMFKDISEALNPANPKIIRMAILALIAMTILFIWSRRPESCHWGQPAVFAVMLLDLGLLAAPRIRMAPMVYLNGPPLAHFLAGQHGGFRLYGVTTQSDIVSRSEFYQQLGPNYNLLFGVDHVGVYSALGSRRYHELTRPLGSVNLAFGLPPVTEKDLMRHRPLLNLLNARYVVSNEPLNVTGLRQERFGPPFLYRNEQVLPRAFVVPTAQLMPDAASGLKILQSPSFDPAAVVLIESPAAEAAIQGRLSTAHISVYADQYISLQAEGPGWLVVTDLDYPGWQARVDGRDAKIYRGDYVFRALPLPPGEHRVEFTFHSKSFRSGAALSGFSGLVLLLLSLISARRKMNMVSD